MDKKKYFEEWYKKNRDKILEKQREKHKVEYPINKEKICKRKREWYKKNRDRLRIKNKKYAKEWYKKMKEKIIYHYAGNPPKCQCCDFDEGIIFLTIDHINGGGRKERKNVNPIQFLRNIIKNDYPNSYQVICANCNHARRMNGGICPHQIK